MRPPVRSAAETRRGLRAHAGAVARSYSEILFLGGWREGAVILLLSLLAPNVALSGLVAVLAAYLFARFVGLHGVYLESGFYTYNPLLVGLSIGYLFRLTPLTAFVLVAAGVTAFVVTHALFSAVWHYLRLPVLSLPFVLVSSVAYLAASRYTNLYVESLYPRPVLALETAVPLWIGGFLRSLGAIFFMPSVVAGAVLALVIVVRSRILLATGILGYAVGIATLGALSGSPATALQDLNAFNFILIGMALGGIFLIPSWQSYVLAAVAVVTSTLLLSSSEVFWSQWGVPVFALPFNVVVLSFVYVLALVEYPLRARTGGTPEEILDEHLAGALRYPGSTRTLALPFAGRWTVWQAFDGEWTHQGAWRYAYDFVITDDDGATHRGSGTELDDYLAYRKPVLAPVQGRVVRIRDGVPDNPPGEGNREDNWGNLVLIEDPRGFHVEISHFAPGSLKVTEGEWVRRGTLLGLCGNSGYSPQPHIHVQVQATDRIGDATLPFSFVSYVDGGRFHANDLPATGARIEPLHRESGPESRLSFVLDEVLRYRVARADPRRFPGLGTGEVELRVRMAADGSFFLDSGRGRLYLGTHEGTFYTYRLEGRDPLLAAHFLALPRMPLALRPGLVWTDHVPAGLLARGPRRWILGLVRSLHPRWGTVAVRQTLHDDGRVSGEITSPLIAGAWTTDARLHPVRGLGDFEVGELRVERIDADGAPPAPAPSGRERGGPGTLCLALALALALPQAVSAQTAASGLLTWTSLSYPGSAVRDDGSSLDVYGSVGWDYTHLVELLATRTDIAFSDGSTLEQWDATVAYTRYWSRGSLRGGLHLMDSSDPLTDGGTVVVVAASLYDPGVWSAGVEGALSSYPNYGGGLHVWQVAPSVGVSRRLGESGPLASASARGVVVALSEPLEDSERTTTSVELGASLAFQRVALSGTGWFGQQAFAVRSGGFLVFNLSEVRSGGYGATVRVVTSDRTAVTLGYFSERFESVGLAETTRARALALSFGFTF